MEHILIVEDDQAIARIEKDYLEAGGYRGTLAENGETGPAGAVACSIQTGGHELR